MKAEYSLCSALEWQIKAFKVQDKVYWSTALFGWFDHNGLSEARWAIEYTKAFEKSFKLALVNLFHLYYCSLKLPWGKRCVEKGVKLGDDFGVECLIPSSLNCKINL